VFNLFFGLIPQQGLARIDIDRQRQSIFPDFRITLPWGGRPRPVLHELKEISCSKSRYKPTIVDRAVDKRAAGLGNTRRFYCNSNSRVSELQGIGQILSPLEFYCRELIKHSEVPKRIGKSGHKYNSNKRAILSSKQLSLCLVDS
jgi:hypothetical protein